jgi:hypothetical protein
VKDLARKLMRYVQAYSASGKPFVRKYIDVHHRITIFRFLAISTETISGASWNCPVSKAPVSIGLDARRPQGIRS